MLKSYVGWLKLIVILAAVYLLSQVTSVYLPVIIAMVLTFILNPLVNFFANTYLWPTKWRVGRGVAVLLAFICAAIVLIVVSTFVLLPFAHEFNKLVTNLPGMILQIQKLTAAIQERASAVYFANNIPNVVEQGMASAAAFSVDMVRRIVNSIFSFASRVVELVIVPVLTYYFLKDWQVLKESVILLFSSGTRDKVQVIIEEMGSVVSGYIRGQVMVSVIIGLTVFCGMYLFGVDYPLVLGLIATLTETIPIIGPIIGAVPAVLLAYLVAPALALKVIVFFVIVHQIENHIVVPNVMGHVIDLHPVTVIISLLIGGQLFGIAGMMLAVPLAALLKVLMRHLWITGER